MLTPLGKELRKLRMDKGIMLKDMADALGITSSYLSAIEFGKRAVPDNFAERLAKAMQLTEMEKARLQKYATKAYTLKAHSPEQQQLAAGLARRFDKLSEEELEKIRSILEEGGNE